MSIDTKVEQLESVSIDVLLEFLMNRSPEETLIDRARVAQASFSAIQKRRSAENQKEALQYMIQREGLVARVALPASANGAATSSKSARAD